MAEHTITPADVEALASALERARPQLSEQDDASLLEVFRLAGVALARDAVAPVDEDVEGFALTPEKVEAHSENVRRATLYSSFSLGLTCLPPPAPSPVPLPYPNVS